jgi:hypothetical protein
VRSIIARMMLLFSVLLMPLGMAPATGAGHARQVMAAMPMGHCDEGSPKHGMKGGFAECTMACSAALPAAERPNDASPPVGCAPVLPIAAQVLHGIHPETATPPPRHS